MTHIAFYRDDMLVCINMNDIRRVIVKLYGSKEECERYFKQCNIASTPHEGWVVVFTHCSGNHTVAPLSELESIELQRLLLKFSNGASEVPQ